MKKRMSKIQREEKLKAMIWDNFWDAKLKEFLLVILLVVVGYVLPMFIGGFLIDNEIIFKQGFCGVEGQCDFVDKWEAGVLTLFFLFMVGWIPYIIIKSNWDDAKKKAKWDLEDIERY